ncbi:MAG: ABC transporter substrate-binding protein [Burkholderiaceae bacterium]|jgi:glucose/mannose transport system substrate-binding protein|nr:ABC transporter substrate-binding protein [Betaproteobacteria bacterium]MDA9218774.1 ABC transporter substrate-binding protein [Burkholderiaceae bacterium]MDO7554171.1 ABC transporter substrate-binding protein [Burkholderiaceae bacterium]MDO7579271.1 ABC transporter substrate-binding protein [Burkholderiaceae bacterium]MDO7594833.1 ABC transporter substrate-binding protein [Burkholderiaceae bacterium]
MKRSLIAAVVSATMATGAVAAESVEVLHWWTSGGEAAALGVLKKDLESQGITWNDMPVAGGGGEAAMTALRARVTSGNPPSAVQALGFDITDWAKQGVVANLNDLAGKEGWDNVVPTALQKFSKHDGKWVAAPVNVHSTNWVWANKAVLDKAGVNTMPQNWDEFIVALDKVQKAGYVGLAHGGQAWQDATLFDGVVLTTGGVDFYNKAFVQKDPKALNSATMVKAFDRMSQLRSYVDKDFSNRDWNLASAMVIEGKAGFQIMGDWAKGEFLKAKKVPNKDFLCMRVPGTQGMVSFNSDQFMMFKVGADSQGAQTKLAKAIMNPSFQSAFNVVKGSVPARTDVPNTAFDDCGKKGMADLADANKSGQLVGSMAHGHAVPASIKNGFYDVITGHFNGTMTSAAAAKAMAEAAE